MTMDESLDSSGSRNLMRTARSPTILHHHNPPTNAHPSPVSQVIEVNRPLRGSRRDHSFGAQEATRHSVPRTSRLQPYIFQFHGPTSQQHPTSINTFVPHNNLVNRQWDVNGVQDNVRTLLCPVVRPGGLGELIPLLPLSIMF